MAARVVWCRACGSLVPFSLQGCASCGGGLLRPGEAVGQVGEEPPSAPPVAAVRPKRGQGRMRDHG